MFTHTVIEGNPIVGILLNFLNSQVILQRLCKIDHGLRHNRVAEDGRGRWGVHLTTLIRTPGYKQYIEATGHKLRALCDLMPIFKFRVAVSQLRTQQKLPGAAKSCGMTLA
jgi:hypothetical protein